MAAVIRSTLLAAIAFAGMVKAFSMIGNNTKAELERHNRQMEAYTKANIEW